MLQIDITKSIYLFGFGAGSFAFIYNKNIHLSTGLLLPTERQRVDYASFLFVVVVVIGFDAPKSLGFFL